MNEGLLGKFSFGGERVATDDHPVIIHALPLSAAVTAALGVGTLLKRVNVADSALAEPSNLNDVAWEPYNSTDVSATPCAVVDKPCDPTDRIGGGETSAIAVVHGTVKTRLLQTGDGKVPTGAELAKLADNGIFAV